MEYYCVCLPENLIQKIVGFFAPVWLPHRVNLHSNSLWMMTLVVGWSEEGGAEWRFTFSRSGSFSAKASSLLSITEAAATSRGVAPRMDGDAEGREWKINEI